MSQSTTTSQRGIIEGPTLLHIAPSAEIEQITITLEEDATDLRLSCGGVDVHKWPGPEPCRKFVIKEFSETTSRKFRELYLEVIPGTYAVVFIQYKADSDVAQPSDKDAHNGAPSRPGMTTRGAATVKPILSRLPATQELLRGELQVELRLGTSTLSMIAIGLEDPENAESLREALRTKDPDHLEACLPLSVYDGPDSVRVSPASYVARDKSEWPECFIDIEIERAIWDQALDDLALAIAAVPPGDGFETLSAFAGAHETSLEK